VKATTGSSQTVPNPAPPLKGCDDVESLAEKYWALFYEEGPIELEEFLQQIKAGKHGDISPKEIDDFLDEMLATMLGNIQVKASESPEYEAMRADVEIQTEQRMARLKAEYGSRGSTDSPRGGN